MFIELLNSFTFSHILLPILIFVARICDVTLGTLRILFVSKGIKVLAPIVGFFEVFIWVIVISELLNSCNGLFCYIAYAGGFATGNYVGMLIEERIAIGSLLVRITTPKNGHELMMLLNKQGFGTTLVYGQGSKGEVNIIQSVISRKSIKEIQQLLSDFDPNLFYTIEDVRSVVKGVFPTSKAVGRSLRVDK